VDGRIVDLSHQAARQIDLIGPGVAKVRLEVIRAPENASAGLFAVQVGAFRDPAAAERLRGEMAVRYGSARLVPRTGSPPLWRILVGTEATEDGANRLAAQIMEQLGEKNAFVVRLDTP
jgi:rare lipoprotein A